MFLDVRMFLIKKYCPGTPEMECEKGTGCESRTVRPLYVGSGSLDATGLTVSPGRREYG